VVLGNPVTTLAALPDAEAEAVEVADLLNTTVYTGAAASELQLRTVVSGASVLHLAAHGNYNTANALYSAIALATDEAKAYDGLLETHEIFGLPLQGNALVMLSSCETNVGAVSRGDEVVGLTRSFFFAGSPTVISSLWNVNDSATGALMTAFYRHWKDKGMSKAEALQAAQADVRSNPHWASPFYWAGFVLNGHPGKSHAE
jgi:CHAT domain-containing protein